MKKFSINLEVTISIPQVESSQQQTDWYVLYTIYSIIRFLEPDGKDGHHVYREKHINVINLSSFHSQTVT